MAIPGLTRSSGVQLHPTSLPGGRLGSEAFAFVDWLADAGQGWWQMLPLGPPDEALSPYKSASAFAAWPGLLAEPDAPVSVEEEDLFRRRASYWIEDWERHAGPGAVADQVRFDREWSALRRHAAERGVKLIGDVPIYVAPGSADHLAHPEIFRSDEVAGVAPDFFSQTGQLWGNPLYDWPALRRRRYGWWTARLRRTFELFDVARIDHFRGFVAYWAVPAAAAEATAGRWKRGPGRAVFEAARRELGPLRLIAEDLGVITPPVTRLRRELGLPGMVVLQFAFDPDDRDSIHHPDRHESESVVYTGTHDNDTIRGWWESAGDGVRENALAAMREAGIDEPEPWWGMVRLALSSRASLAMLQAQDVLGLGAEARMNVPGTEGTNWRWRLEPGALTPELAARLRQATDSSRRGPW
jgi:4-alpha-glucanotransferase